MKYPKGTRVELIGLQWGGRVGTVRNKHFGIYYIWCDDPDGLGRRLVRVTRFEMKKLEDQSA